MDKRACFDEWQELSIDEFTLFKSLKLSQRIKVKELYATMPIKQALFSLKPVKVHAFQSLKQIVLPNDLHLIASYKTGLSPDEVIHYEALHEDKQNELAMLYDKMKSHFTHSQMLTHYLRMIKAN